VQPSVLTTQPAAAAAVSTDVAADAATAEARQALMTEIKTGRTLHTHTPAASTAATAAVPIAQRTFITPDGVPKINSKLFLPKPAG